MRILITGATGYIGFNVAQALRRGGHEVWGLVRSEDKARMLERSEIRPVSGSLQNPDTFRAAAEGCSVLIHAAADYRADTFAVDRQTVQVLLEAAKSGPRPKTLVYTSGVWVYGNTGAKLVDETTPVDPVATVLPRPERERMVLEAAHVRGVVLRPGCVYGRQGGMTGDWFTGAYLRKSLQAVGDGNNRWAMVHVDDLADLYLRAVESDAAGVFNATDRSRSTIREMIEAAARAADYTGEIRFVPLAEAAKTMGNFAECLALDQHVDSRKAVRLLGWQPRHGGFADEAETYFVAWKAAQG